MWLLLMNGKKIDQWMSLSGNCMRLDNIDMQVIYINEWGEIDQWMSLYEICMQMIVINECRKIDKIVVFLKKANLLWWLL